MKAKTISVFLPDGNPNGVKEVELSNRIIKAILVPRAHLKAVKDMEELARPALYILCEKNGDKVYIGESESFYTRVKNHDQKKDFWEIAIAFFAKDNSLEKGDVKYLESIAVERGKAAHRFDLQNATIPMKNNLHKFKVAMVEGFFEDIQLLISTLGYPLFDTINTNKVDEQNIWHISSKDAEAKGIYDENGFTLLAGSVFTQSVSASYAATEKRANVIASFTEESAAGQKILQQNYTCSSPSTAASLILGYSVNGWTSWKNKAGQTLDTVFRSEV